jgi:hypothetical protein
MSDVATERRSDEGEDITRSSAAAHFPFVALSLRRFVAY